MTAVHLNHDSPVFPEFNEHDHVRLKSGGPLMSVVYECDGEWFCTWETESAGVIGSFFHPATIVRCEPELVQPQQVLTDADAAADLAGEPRPAPWTQQRTLDLGVFNEPLTSFSGYLSTMPPYVHLDLANDIPLPQAQACGLSNPGCEACE